MGLWAFHTFVHETDVAALERAVQQVLYQSEMRLSKMKECVVEMNSRWQDDWCWRLPRVPSIWKRA